MRAVGSTLVVTALLGVNARASAYSDPARFAAPVLEGGAEGRWFTGSVTDGHTCRVCHSGGRQAPVRIDGLPLNGYVPGATYAVVVDWPDAVIHVGVSVELSDRDGRAAGVVALPASQVLEDADVCFPYAARLRAATLVETEDNRGIVTVADCGARQLRFLWTAPIERATIPILFSGALVAGDGSDSHGNDGVTTFARALQPVGASEHVELSGACAVIENTRPCVASTGWLALCIAWLLRRRLR